MKIRKKWIISILLIGLGIALVVAIPIAREWERRAGCCSNLHNLDITFYMYALDNNNANALPPNIAALCCTTGGSCYITSPWIFLCKGSHSHAGSLTNVDAWMDYIYIPWSTGVTNTPPDYPVMYDRRLSNHQGKGINVLFADHSVIWDKDAKELKAFATKHPEFHIPLPEDAKR